MSRSGRKAELSGHPPVLLSAEPLGYGRIVQPGTQPQQQIERFLVVTLDREVQGQGLVTADIDNVNPRAVRDGKLESIWGAAGFTGPPHRPVSGIFSCVKPQLQALAQTPVALQEGSNRSEQGVAQVTKDLIEKLCREVSETERHGVREAGLEYAAGY